jgi:F-type H+-transporting ATPase subunit delta
MISGAAARRYARALFSIAEDEGSIEIVRGDLTTFSDLFAQNAEVKRALFRPLHPAKERRAVLVRICERVGAQPVVKNFFSFLVDQRRLVDFSAIRQEFERLADQAEGRTTASIISASPLGDQERERLRRALSARTGGEVELDVEVDPTLIGGVIAKVGNLVFDGSLRTQLNQLRASLTKGH